MHVGSVSENTIVVIAYARANVTFSFAELGVFAQQCDSGLSIAAG